MIKLIFRDFYAPLDQSQHRHQLIDFLRIIAVLLMIVFHTGFDLHQFGLLQLNFKSGFWFWLPRVIIFLFFFCSGATRERVHSTHQSARNLSLFIFSLIISISTFILFPKGWIFFGILHSLWLASLLSTLFKGKRLRQWMAILIISTLYLTLPYTFEDLLSYYQIFTLDFIPIYPWFAFYLLGMLCADKLNFNKFPLVFTQSRLWQVLSQKTLPIYLLHQPILISLLAAAQALFTSI